MHNKCLCLGLMLIMFIAIADTAIATGSDAGPTYSVTADYAARPAFVNSFYPVQYDIGTGLVTLVNSDIGPHEQKHFTKNVTGDIDYLNVDLTWANPRVGLKLLVFTPGGVEVGYFSDDADGVIDQRINIDIYEVNGGYIEKGRWDYYVIYGWGVERTAFTI